MLPLIVCETTFLKVTIMKNYTNQMINVSNDFSSYENRILLGWIAGHATQFQIQDENIWYPASIKIIMKRAAELDNGETFKVRMTPSMISIGRYVIDSPIFAPVEDQEVWFHAGSNDDGIPDFESILYNSENLSHATAAARGYLFANREQAVAAENAIASLLINSRRVDAYGE